VRSFGTVKKRKTYENVKFGIFFRKLKNAEKQKNDANFENIKFVILKSLKVLQVKQFFFAQKNAKFFK
jgi:hypothetical protein